MVGVGWRQASSNSFNILGNQTFPETQCGFDGSEDDCDVRGRTAMAAPYPLHLGHSLPIPIGFFIFSKWMTVPTACAPCMYNKDG